MALGVGTDRHIFDIADLEVEQFASFRNRNSFNTKFKQLHDELQCRYKSGGTAVIIANWSLPRKLSSSPPSWQQ